MQLLERRDKVKEETFNVCKIFSVLFVEGKVACESVPKGCAQTHEAKQLVHCRLCVEA